MSSYVSKEYFAIKDKDGIEGNEIKVRIWTAKDQYEHNKKVVEKINKKWNTNKTVTPLEYYHMTIQIQCYGEEITMSKETWDILKELMNKIELPEE